jgi:hypothetical protein
LIASPFVCPDEMTSASVMPLFFGDPAAALKQWQGSRGSAAEVSQTRPADFLCQANHLEEEYCISFFGFFFRLLGRSLGAACASVPEVGPFVETFVSRGLSGLDQTKAQV